MHTAPDFSPSNLKHIHRLAVATGLVTIVLTGAAFALSYDHLHTVAANNGVTNIVAAWAWPATVDLFIIAGELLTLRGALRGVADKFAIFLTALGSVASIALNVAGVGGGMPTMHYIVAAVPPAAALVAFGMAMRQIHEKLQGAPAALVPATLTEAANIPVVSTSVAVHERPELADAPPPQPSAPPAALWTPSKPEPVAALTVAEVADHCGVAEATVRSWVRRNKLTPISRDGRLMFDRAAVVAL